MNQNAVIFMSMGLVCVATLGFTAGITFIYKGSISKELKKRKKIEMLYRKDKDYWKLKENHWKLQEESFKTKSDLQSATITMLKADCSRMQRELDKALRENKEFKGVDNSFKVIK